MAVTEQVERQAARVKHAEWVSWRRSPWVVAGCVLAVYAVWIGAYLLGGHDIRDFINVGTRFLGQSNVSSAIRVDPTYRYRSPDGIGYDGQFAYYIALDPPNAHVYMDFPAYRYTRILYPMLARALAFGQPALIPYTLLLINYLAVVGGTLTLALWLKRRGHSPWLALIYAFSYGMLIGLQADLTEPLAFALVGWGVYFFDSGYAARDQKRIIISAGCFALAALTRETTAVFAALYGATLLVAGAQDGARTGWWDRILTNWHWAGLYLGVALAPLALYKLYLLAWLGSAGVPNQVRFESIPFAGLFAYWPWDGLRIQEVDLVVAPALICLGLAIWAIRRGMRSVRLWALIASVVLFVILLPASSYVNSFASARIALCIPMWALYCVPDFDQLVRNQRLWLVAASALWIAFVPLQAIGSIVSR